MKYGFVKVAAATPIIRVSDCKKNTDAIIAQIKEANIEGAALVNFPELCITGYTCSDLFLQQTLLKTAESSVYRIIEETKNLDIISVVGVPVAFREALYNCAAVIFKGKLLALVPKAKYSEIIQIYDHMSMYAVNVSIPKTLVRYLTAYEAEISDGELKTVLLDVLDTPVSPELLPPDKNGEIAQKTEDVVGPYELHDFFLYYFVRFGFTPSKIYYLAKHSFAGKYNNDTIKKWLVTFLKRFFSQQFKRSCLPDGPKVGSVTLSPRSDWRMPSDASVRIWLDELENQ